MPFQIDVTELSDYSGQDAATAETAIEAAGFTVDKVYARSDSVAAGNVISQGVRADPFQHVILLTISIGGYSAADRAALMAYHAYFAATPSNGESRPNTTESLGL